MYYAGTAPDGASNFEEAFGLDPLGPEVTPARLARLEAIAGLFVSAAVDPNSRKATMWIGQFSSTEYELPVPSEEAAGTLLDQFRTQDEINARQEAIHADLNEEV